MDAGGDRMAMKRAGSGKPMVLLHGVGSDRSIWALLMPRLAEHFDVIGLDMPGYGDTPPLPEGEEPTVPALARAVARELDAIGVRKPHLVGHSMGGWVCFELARRGLARTVVALSPAGAHTVSEGRRENITLATQRYGARLVAPLGRLPFLLGPIKALGLRTMFGKPGNVDAEAAALATRKIARAPSFHATRRWMTSHNPEGLDEITCPVLIAWGTKDRLLTPKQGPRLVGEISGSQLRLMPGLGHALQCDDPELVSSLILEFAAQG
jgi:pimeloyl-ACP methyl ester carboxylesterase